MTRLWVRLTCAVGAAGLFGLWTSRPLMSQQYDRLREPGPDSQTPGVLLGVVSPPNDRLIPDASVDHEAIPSMWELDPQTGSYYRRGELLVRFKEGTGAALRALALAETGARAVAKVLPEGWELIELNSQVSTTDALGLMRKTDNVESAFLNYRMRALQRRPNDEFFNVQWNFEALDLPSAWEINPGATSSVVVAVVDSGLNIGTRTFTFFTPFGSFPVRFASVPDLVTSTNIVHPYDFVYRDEFPVDFVGHGTHVAGTIAQATNNSIGPAGVAYNVKLMPLKVLADADSWDELLYPRNPGGEAEIIAEAIHYAANNGAHVINLSLGGPGPAPIIRDAIRYAVTRGAFVAIAAGNDAERGNPRFYPAAYGAEINGAMTVGAVSRSLRRASYSGFQPYVEICAPGGDTPVPYTDYDQAVTQVTYDPYVTLSDFSFGQKLAALRLGLRPSFDVFAVVAYDGTSVAAPHVTGVAALLYSQGITNPAAIEEAIKRFARPINAAAVECGAGLVDPRRALRGLGLAR